VTTSTGASSSGYGFTGEYQQDSLVYLRARHYAPGMGRFLTRDIWEGDELKPMSYNLWLYTYADPINNLDPSGLQTISQIFADYVDEYDEKRNPTAARWKNHEILMINRALGRIALAYANAYALEAERRGLIDDCATNPWMERLYIISSTKRVDPFTAFFKIHGGRIKIIKHNRFAGDSLGAGTWGTGLTKDKLDIYKAGYFDDKLPYLTRYGKAGMDVAIENYERFITHEMGHLFDHAMGDQPRRHPDLIAATNYNTAEGFCGPKLVNSEVLVGWQWRFTNGPEESFADMYIGWVYGCWEKDPKRPSRLTELGQARSDFMDENMPKWIFEKIEGTR
jgi:RHS repeat-associated protein